MKKLFLSIAMIALMFSFGTPVHAQDLFCILEGGDTCVKTDTNLCEESAVTFDSLKTCQDAIPVAKKKAEEEKQQAQAEGKCTIKGDNCTPLENPLGNVTDIKQILGGIVNTAMGILGSLALLVFIAGGFMWLTAAGREEQIKKGTHTMVWAAIGIIVIFSSYAIITLVLQGIGVS